VPKVTISTTTMLASLPQSFCSRSLYRCLPAGVFDSPFAPLGASRAVRVPMLFAGPAPLNSFALLAARNN
jgi:hypothetical protein